MSYVHLVEPTISVKLSQSPSLDTNLDIDLGIDLMGGESPPEVIFEAVKEVATRFPHCHFYLFGNVDFSVNSLFQNIQLVPTHEVITMDDAPLQAVRTKKHSSMVTGIQWLREKRLSGFLSCGNTGALIAASALYLERLPSLAKPALLAILPLFSTPIVVLDVGAQVVTGAEQLVQYAYFGAAFHQKKYGTKLPRVALLNIGTESKKGTKEHARAYERLIAMKEAPFDFIGNKEGREVFSGDIDVLVTDGFAGNIFLKTAEGVMAYFSHRTRQTVSVDATYGAYVVGVEPLVMKCHGNASKDALSTAIMSCTKFS